jgi:hypothetical protein
MKGGSTMWTPLLDTGMMILKFLLGVALYSLVAGLILRFAVKWVQNTTLAYAQACVMVFKAVVFSICVQFMIMFPLSLAFTLAQENGKLIPKSFVFALALIYPINIIVLILLVGSRLKISHGRAGLVVLAMLGVLLIGLAAVGIGKVIWALS